MKILQVIPYFPPAYAFGGPVKVAHQVSRELVKRKHEVFVYTSDAKDFDSRLRTGSDNVIDGIRVHYFRNLALMPAKKFKLLITPHLISHAKEEVKKFDVIHLHEYRTFQNIAIAHYARKYGVPYVLQAHGSLPRIGSWRRLKWFYDVLFGYRLLRDAAKVIALSQVEAEQYRRMGVPEERIAIIPNGIDLSEYAQLPPKGSFKKKYGIEEEKVVLYLGRIHKTKGIDFLVKAYAHLINEINFKDAVLVIAGPDDGYLAEAKRLVTSLKVSDKVIFTGFLSEKEKISAYVDSSLVVYPSPVEPFGLVTLEAAASSRPVIVSDKTPMASIVKKGEFGYSVKYGDVNELAEIMHKMLSDENLLKKMGQRGRKFVFENYNWTNIVAKLEKIYEEIVSESSQRRLDHIII